MPNRSKRHTARPKWKAVLANFAKKCLYTYFKHMIKECISLFQSLLLLPTTISFERPIAGSAASGLRA